MARMVTIEVPQAATKVALNLEGSYEDLRTDICRMLRESSYDSWDSYCCVEQTFPTYFFYSKWSWDGSADTIWKQEYHLDDRGEPVFDGDPQAMEIDVVPMGTGQFSDEDDDGMQVIGGEESGEKAGTKAALTGGKRSALADSDFAYVEPGHKVNGKTPDKYRHYPINNRSHVRNALARLSGGQSPFADKARKKVQAAARRMGITDSSTPKAGGASTGKAFGGQGDSLLSRIGDMLGNLRGKKEVVPDAPAFWLTKDANGRTRFMCVMSNNYRDRDQELFTAASHKDYVQWCETHDSYPELWQWHVKGTKYGQFDRLDYVEAGQGGILFGTGLIDEGKEAIAEKTASMDVAMSHGFIGLYQEGGIWTAYRSWEGSTLPREAVANYGTAFNLIRGMKEENMALKPETQAYLKSVGLSEEEVTAASSTADSFAKGVSDLATKFGLDSKAAKAPVTNPDGTQAEGASTEGTKELASLVIQTMAGVKDMASVLTGFGEKLDSIEGTAKQALTNSEAALATSKKDMNEAIADLMKARAQTPGFSATSDPSNVLTGGAKAVVTESKEWGASEYEKLIGVNAGSTASEAFTAVGANAGGSN